jgi:DNA-binding MarR family transcriptional regulator
MLLNTKEQDILNEFIGDYSKKIYGRDIAKRLKMNQKTVSNILNSLERENILKFSTEGKNKYYFLNTFNSHLKEIIAMTEIKRKIDFLEKNKNIKDLFAKLEQKSKGILVIFGSYVKSKQNKESDLDVFSIGEIEDTHDLEDIYGIKINIIKSEKSKFQKEVPLINEIINNHIILKGTEEFIELTWQA